MQLGRSLVIGLLCASVIWAGQIVTMSDGQKLRVDRAEKDGEQVFLLADSNVRILNASEVQSIEDEPDPKKPQESLRGDDRGDIHADTKALIREAARVHGLPVRIVESIAEVESAMRTNAVSHKGAIGVMQLMPGTARQLGVDPYDVAQNIEGGTRYLKELLIRYQNSPNQVALALAAYNAGPGAVQRYEGVPPYVETRKYVRKVLRRFDNKSERQ